MKLYCLKLITNVTVNTYETNLLRSFSSGVRWVRRRRFLGPPAMLSSLSKSKESYTVISPLLDDPVMLPCLSLLGYVMTMAFDEIGDIIINDKETFL